MRDEQRATPPPRVKTKAPAGAPRPVQSRSAAPGAGTSRPKSNQGPKKDMYARPDPVPRQKTRPAPSRREAEYLYPDDAYYRKRPSGKPVPSAKKRGKPKKGKKKRANPLYTLFYLVFAVVVALLISFLLRTFVFEIVRVNGDAMYQTLIPGDWVIVTKFDYWSSQPKRGEIIAVRVNGTDEGVILRRVVAGPGETVEINANGDTIVDGQHLGEGYVTLRSYDEYPETTLGPGKYFVLSDNRDNTQTVKLDSRDERVGPVSKKDILGRVRGIVWPLDRR